MGAAPECWGWARGSVTYMGALTDVQVEVYGIARFAKQGVRVGASKRIQRRCGKRVNGDHYIWR